MDLWAENSAGPLLLLNGGFGVGASIAPLLTSPFLSYNKTIPVNTSDASAFLQNNTIGNISMVNTSLVEYNTTRTVRSESRIQIPYMILGLACFIIASLFFVFYVIKVPKMFVMSKPLQKLGAMLRPESCAGGDRAFGIQMLILLFVFSLLVMGGEQAFGKFIYSYCRGKHLKFTPTNAATFNSIWWLAFTLARFVAFGISRFISVQMLMLGQVVGTVVSCILMNILYNNAVGFCVFSVLFGFFRSPLFPTAIAWGNRYMEVTAMVVGLMNIGVGFGGMIIQWLTGYLFQNHGQLTLLHSSLVLSILILFIYVIMQFIAFKHGTRTTKYSGKDDKSIDIESVNEKSKQIEYDNGVCQKELTAYPQIQNEHGVQTSSSVTKF